MDLFRSRGHVVAYAEESFEEASWVTMYAGFAILPEQYDSRVDKADFEMLARDLAKIRSAITAAAASAPRHAEFIARHCVAGASEVDVRPQEAIERGIPTPQLGAPRPASS